MQSLDHTFIFHDDFIVVLFTVALYNSFAIVITFIIILHFVGCVHKRMQTFFSERIAMNSSNGNYIVVKPRVSWRIRASMNTVQHLFNFVDVRKV